MYGGHDGIQLLASNVGINFLFEDNLYQGAGVSAGDGGHSYLPSFPSWPTNSRSKAWSVVSSTLILCDARSTASVAA